MAAGRGGSLRSPGARSALLNLFQGVGAGVDQAGQPIRSRANRRHPDVGYLSRDPICLTCVLAALDGVSSSAPAPAAPPRPAREATSVQSLTLPPAPESPAPIPSTTVWQEPEEPPILSVLPFGEPEIVLGGPDPIPIDAPRQTPGPLPILGVGAGFGFSRRLRRRIRAGRR